MTTQEIKDWTIEDIEVMTEETAKEMAIESMVIKEHNVYFVDFGGYFGYSALVFKNKHHIRYADDYELHHKGKTPEELREWYIEALNNKLYTESELLEPIKSYDESELKSYYLRNYYGMQESYVSIWFVGTNEERERIKKKTENMIYNPVAFAYYDKSKEDFVNHHIELYNQFEKIQEQRTYDPEYMESAFYSEMSNHEYYINWQGDWDVCSCFCKCEYGSDKTYQDYLKEGGFSEEIITAFETARRKYIKACNEFDVL